MGLGRTGLGQHRRPGIQDRSGERSVAGPGQYATTGIPDWSYDFFATDAGSFSLNYWITGDGEDLGMGAWRLLVSEDSDSPLITTLSSDFDIDPVTRTGSISQTLELGHSYRVSLFSKESLTRGVSDDVFVGFENDEFNWSIASDAGAVPEPATWTLTIMGFGLAGAALRRRPVVGMA